jgi:riboflavin kinase/FMN adenylyltransferase
MAIFHDIHYLPEFKNPVLTIGTFDGVHTGHKAILKEVVTHAKTVNGSSVLLTFEPHPRKLLFPDQPLGIITPLEEKLKLITETGIEHVVVVPFTKEFASLSAHEYIELFLVGLFHPHSIVIGYDHHFGQDRKGNIKLLEHYAAPLHYELLEIAAQLIDEAAVSSTKIRHYIGGGRIEEANLMLGRPYSLKGTVVHGNKLGRTLGYPTANLQPCDADQVVPGMGIYAIQAIYDGIFYDGMLSIGYNPTVTDTKEIKIEANLFGFNKDIYGETLELLFLKKLRDEQKFASIDALTEQLHRDKEEVISLRLQ